MREITLAAIPNQKFTVQLDGNQYDITIKEARGIMAADVVRNGVTIVSGNRLVSGYPILPYRYQEDGNFFISTLDEEYPYYTSFGDSQVLIYVSAAELVSARG